MPSPPPDRSTPWCSRCLFFSSRRRHTRLQGDWSSDVCSSDLGRLGRVVRVALEPGLVCAERAREDPGVVGVEQWAEIRRLHFVKGLSQREIRRRTGLHRDTIRKAINGTEPPVFRRAPSGSKLDPFKDEIHRLLKDDSKL